MDYKNKMGRIFLFFLNEKWMSGMGRFTFYDINKLEKNAKPNRNVLPLS